MKPHVDYLIEVSGTAAKTNLEPFQTAQNKIKVLLQYKYWTPIQKIYKDTKIINIKQTNNYYTCILIRKMLFKDIHTTILFTKIQDYQRNELRNSNFLVTCLPITNYGKKGLGYEEIKMCNELSMVLKETTCMAN